jgi:hypothetical protein
MRRSLPAFVILLAIIASAPANAKPKKPSVPEAFGAAHTVFVEARDDRDITDISLDPDDRKAILDVQDGIQDWGRYTLSRSRLDADLILVVYKGRVVRDQPNSGAQGNMRLPGGRLPVQDPSDVTQNGTNSISPDGLTREKDQLLVYQIPSGGKLKDPIWRSEQERGLDAPSVLLLRRLKDEVEKAYPSAPAKQQSTP